VAGAVIVVVAALCCGCGGGGEFPTAAVSGTVTHDGKSVRGGSLTFSPVKDGEQEAGKPASATVGEDGTYELSTYGEGDGAVIGKHRVSYSPPAAEPVAAADGGHAQQSVSPYAGLTPKQPEVEVTSGSNTINIELGR
jgi:hypothetical protein